jgi:hypothetical protein
MTDEEMAHYSRALDEIHRLRGLLVYESLVLQVHLDYKSFPKSRRKIAEEQIACMGQAALVFSEKAMESVDRRSMRQIRQEYGIETLTRREFETELAAREATA